MGLLRPMVGTFLAALLEEFGDQAGPTRLMAGANAGAVVAVEVLVKQRIILPMRIGLEFLLSAEHGTATGGVSDKRSDETMGQLHRYLPQVHHLT